MNQYSGTLGQYTAVDDWADDSFDHSGLGFISGGMVSATMEKKPIMGRRTPFRPAFPTWGSAYKAWLAANHDSVGSISAQMETFSYPQNYCDLDPVVKDDLGRPVLRITFALQQNEINSALYMQAKIKGVRRPRPVGRHLDQPAGRGTRRIPTRSGHARMGNDPDTSVIDKWQISHEVPNLLVLGGAAFPTTASRNPTETIQATSWRAGHHLATHFKSIAD